MSRFSINLEVDAASSEIADAADAALWLTQVLANRDSDSVVVQRLDAEVNDA